MTNLKSYIEDRKQPNAGFLFYKKYYTDDAIIEGNYQFEKTNNDIINTKLRFIENPETNQKFELETIYPGLVTGIGHVHEIKDDRAKDDKSPINNPFKIGFEFDYTTGLPLLHGSSVKGVLRSAFPNQHIKKEKNPYKEEKKNYIKLLLKDKLGINDDIDIDKLEKEIFDGLDNEGKPKSIYKRDIFYEAVPISSIKKLFGTDYITHHEHPLKNPNPIMFLKIMPQVVFEFRFKLHNGLIDEKSKKDLFELIIKDLGVGAKTNVGYGQFKIPRESKIPEKAEEETKAIKSEPENYTGKIKVGEQLEAKVIRQAKPGIVMIQIKGRQNNVEMSGNCPESGTLVKVTINQIL